VEERKTPASKDNFEREIAKATLVIRDVASSRDVNTGHGKNNQERARANGEMNVIVLEQE
jgi:hypothetical protein